MTDTDSDVIGQNVGTAAALAVKMDIPVQKIDVSMFRNQLKEDGVFLEEYRD